MKQPLVSIKVSSQTLRMARILAAYADDKVYTVVERVLEAELRRVQAHTTQPSLDPSHEESIMDHHIPYKPTWMSADDYAEFCKCHPMPQCSIPGCDGLDPIMTVDHIVPRWQGGDDILSNYQWACRTCNSRKGPKDDPYWARTFYFDQAPDMSKLRVYHRSAIWNVILDYADAPTERVWFTRPWSAISRRLYTCVAGVGAGKTIAMPILAMALNHVICRDMGKAAPRVNRMLILAKEKNLRDQIAQELEDELVGYGICGSRPRVRKLDQGSLLDYDATLDTADIWVSCINMLYTHRGQPRKDLERVLALFPLICIDEPHYALDQVLKVVESAATSLCFGFTGTPITANGKAIERYVLFSLYDYQSCTQFDQSLKFLSDEVDKIRDMCEEIPILDADILQQGLTERVEVLDPEHQKTLVAATTVAQRVIEYLYACDEEHFAECAPHRLADAVPDYTYPMHALIKVDAYATGAELDRQINNIFAANRRRFPQQKGWRAEIVYAPREDEEEEHLRGQYLTKNHPWMRSYRHLQGGLDSQCSRILIVIGMGREGVNNPYCGAYGLTCHVESLVTMVQGPIGRLLRSVMRWVPGEHGMALHVPPRRLDTPKIFMHQSSNNMDILQQAIDYVLHMAEYLQRIPTMEDLLQDSVAVAHADLDMDTPFSEHERFLVAATVGKARRDGREPQAEDLEGDWWRKSSTKEQHVRSFHALVTEEPQAAAVQLQQHPTLAPAWLALRETAMHNPTDEDLRWCITRNYPQLIHELQNLPHNRHFMEALYTAYMEKFYVHEFQPHTTLQRIRRDFARRVKALLHTIGNFDSGDPQQALYQAVGYAMRLKLAVPQGERLRDGSQWDIPQCHTALLRPEVSREISGFAIRHLTMQGHCPDLAAAFAFDKDADFDIEENEAL